MIEKIEKLLPHREPMFLIDKLINIVPLKSATAIMHEKRELFCSRSFSLTTSDARRLIVEAFGQQVAALKANGIDPKEYEGKLVFLMSIDKARFRNPIIPDCELHLEIEAISPMVEFGNTRELQKSTEREWQMLNGLQQ